MLSKCLWKMFNCSEAVRGNFRQISPYDVISSLISSMDTLPRRKDTRSDPIFEPYFKLVSIAHKLVQGGHLPVSSNSVPSYLHIVRSNLRSTLAI